MALKVVIERAKNLQETFDIREDSKTLGERHQIIQDRSLKCYPAEIGYIISSLVA